MSDLAALQGQMGSYASSFADGQQTVSNYISNYDTNAFNTWQDTAAKVRQQGATISSIGGGVLGLQIAGKAAYKKYYGEGSTKSGGAEGGEAGNSNAGAGGAADAGADTAADTGGAADAAVGAGAGESNLATVVGGGGVYEGSPLQAAANQARAKHLGGGDDDEDEEDEGEDDDHIFTNEEMDAAAPNNAPAAAPAASADAAAPASAPAASTDAAADAEAAGGEASTETDAAYATSFDFGDAVTGSAASAVVDAATTAGAAATTAASTAGTAAAAVGSVALEAVPILGAAAAIGFGLYELFSSHSPPSTPDPSKINAPVTASARAENVMPNVDGVVDAPASVTAF